MSLHEILVHKFYLKTCEKEGRKNRKTSQVVTKFFNESNYIVDKKAINYNSVKERRLLLQ